MLEREKDKWSVLGVQTSSESHLENIMRSTVIHAVIEVKDLLEARLCGLVFTPDSVIALVQLGLVGGAVVLGAGLLDGSGRVHKVLERERQSGTEQ